MVACDASGNVNREGDARGNGNNAGSHGSVCRRDRAERAEARSSAHPQSKRAGVRRQSAIQRFLHNPVNCSRDLPNHLCLLTWWTEAVRLFARNPSHNGARVVAYAIIPVCPLIFRLN